MVYLTSAHDPQAAMMTCCADASMITARGDVPADNFPLAHARLLEALAANNRRDAALVIGRQKSRRTYVTAID